LTCRILIADDHQPLRNLLKETLAGHPGWHVCAEATNGREAVQKAAECKPDLIILDLSMPVMDGLEAAREILAASPHLPILLFTNHAVSAVAQDAQKIGIKQILSKTYHGDELLLVVESLLQEKTKYATAALLTGTPTNASHVRVNQQIPPELLSAAASAQAETEKSQAVNLIPTQEAPSESMSAALPAQPDGDQAGAVNSVENRQTPNQPTSLPADTEPPT
jgi:DNA-binding NarL/FixJ family response regulator